MLGALLFRLRADISRPHTWTTRSQFARISLLIAMFASFESQLPSQAPTKGSPNEVPNLFSHDTVFVASV